MFGLDRLSKKYETLGLSTNSGDGEDDQLTSSFVRQCAQHIIGGEWQAGEACAQRVLTVARRIRYARREEEGLALLAHIRYLQGRFGECRALYTAVRSSASRGDPQTICWGLLGLGYSDLIQGQCASAIERSMAGLTLAQQLAGRSEAINLHAILAVGYLRDGDRTRAEHHARMALELGRAASFVTFLEIVAYSCVAEVLQVIAFQHPSLAPLARDGLRQLQRCARVIRVSRPRACLWTAVHHWQQQRPARGRAAAIEGLKYARMYGMPYEETYLELLLALHAGKSASRRTGWDDAHRRFSAMGATFEAGAMLVAMDENRSAPSPRTSRTVAATPPHLRAQQMLVALLGQGAAQDRTRARSLFA
jgi:hypothetical protein